MDHLNLNLFFGKVYRQMAERTYDSEGDFIARGLSVYTQKVIILNINIP